MALRISVRISEATRNELEHFALKRGLSKSHVVEQALEYFMEARPDLEGCSMRLVLEDAAFDRLLKRLKRPAKATPALVELMRGR